jgi:hypothetical protein
MSEHRNIGVGEADPLRVAGGVGGRERTISTVVSTDGGACGAVGDHRRPAAAVEMDTSLGGIGHR